jgi:hypothetical protein
LPGGACAGSKFKSSRILTNYFTQRWKNLIHSVYETLKKL